MVTVPQEFGAHWIFEIRCTVSVIKRSSEKNIGTGSGVVNCTATGSSNYVRDLFLGKLKATGNIIAFCLRLFG